MLRTCVLAWLTSAALAALSSAAIAAGEDSAAPSAAPIAAEIDLAGPSSEGPQAEAARTSEPARSPEAAKSKPTDAAPAAAADTKKTATPVPTPEPTLKVAIDLLAQRMTVSENGAAKYAWPISSGTADHPTPRGTFHPQWTAKMWYSTKYDNAPMPNAVFISGGVAIHATYATSMLGRPASHGCIRLAPANAATFYKLVHRHGLGLTRVSVYGTPNWRAPALASRKSAEPRRYASSLGNWLFDDVAPPRTYRATSAYNYGFLPKTKRRPPGAYVYPGDNPRIVYRRAGGYDDRYFYRPRRYYYGNW